uniref:Type IV pilus assembly protein PilM n=1 Tax=candidate division WOR-3 bacterium TaxID=2052148 RepID=A0A7C4YEX8_UNCW3
MGKRQVVGVDIGSSLIKIIAVEGFPKKPKIVKFAMEYIEPHVIVDGEVMDKEIVVETLKRLCEKTGISTNEVIASIPSRDVIVKKIKMAKMKESEAAEQIKWEAEQYIPYGIEDVVLDFQILNPDVGENMMEVLLVGAKKDSVDARLVLLRDAGLNPVVFEIPIFAIQNIYEYNYGVDSKSLIGHIHIGAQFTSISYVQGAINHFTREITTAVNTLIQAIQRELGVNRERALNMIIGKTTEDVDQFSFKNAFQSFLDDLGVSVERVLPYIPEGFDKLDKIILSGGGALITNLSDFFYQRFGINVEILDPLKKFEIAPNAYEEDLRKIAPIIALPLGLTLRGEG